MDEKTAELREVFLETTGEEVATERQTDERGSLAEGDDEAAVDDLVATMREQYGFATDLDDDAYCVVARRVHEGAGDDDIADELGVDGETVRRARLDLHLVRAADRDLPSFVTLAERIVEDDDDEAIAADVDVDADTVARARAVVETEREAVRANHRFRDAFAERLTDADLETQYVRDAREDGLREATEDIETDVSL